MSHRVYYLASNGRDYVSLDGDGVWIGTANELRSREWSYSTGYRNLTGISRQVREKSVDAFFRSLEKADQLRTFADYDLAHKQPGWVVVDGYEKDAQIVGGWRQRAFIVSSEPDTIERNFLKTSLKITLLDGAWMRGNLIELRTDDSGSSDGLDFSFDFPFDFTNDSSVDVVENTGTSAAPVKIIFYGAGSNPEVTIGNNTYKIETTIPTDSYVTLDGAAYPKKIELTSQYGDIENIFSKGVRSSGKGSGDYCFEEVPVGTYPVTFSGVSAADLIWYEVESEPPWSL